VAEQTVSYTTLQHFFKVIVVLQFLAIFVLQFLAILVLQRHNGQA